jgi:hypothetical protein
MAFPTQIASYTDVTDIGYFSEELLSGYIFDACFKHLAADSTGFGIEEMCWQALPENEDTYELPPGFSQPLAREKLPGLDFAGISTASPVASTAEQSPVSLIQACSENVEESDVEAAEDQFEHNPPLAINLSAGEISVALPLLATPSTDISSKGLTTDLPTETAPRDPQSPLENLPTKGHSEDLDSAEGLHIAGEAFSISSKPSGKILYCTSFQYLTSVIESRFANGIQANSNGDPPNAALENSSTTKFGHQTPQIYRNLEVAQSSDHIAASIGENLLIDALSSDTVEGKYIFIDSEDEMEAKYIIIHSEDENDITSTRPVRILSNSAKRSANGDRPTLAKRPRLALGLTAIRPAALTPPNSPNGSQTHDKRKAQRKPKTRSKVTTRQFKSHMNTENVWLRTASKRCNTLLEVFEQQRKLIESMCALDDNMCGKIAAISVDSMSLKTRQRLGKEIEVVENERHELTATLSDHLRSLFREGGLLEQDLEQWVEKDIKITERIERSH